MTLFKPCGLEDELETSWNIYWKKYFIHGDIEYVLRLWFQVEYDRLTETAAKKSFNNKMRTMMEAAE